MKLLSIFVASLVFSAIAYAQQPEPLMVVWDEKPECGRRNKTSASGEITCRRTSNDVSKNFKTFDNGSVSVSASTSNFSTALRFLIMVENRGEKAIPVDVKSWNLIAFKSRESYENREAPVFQSKAEKPMKLVSRSAIEAAAGSTGLPSNAPLTTSTTERRVLNPATGASSVEKTTRIVSDSSSPLSISLEGRAGESALKWTEIPAKTKKVAEVTFGMRDTGRYLLIAADIDGTVYIYAVELAAKK